MISARREAPRWPRLRIGRWPSPSAPGTTCSQGEELAYLGTEARADGAHGAASRTTCRPASARTRLGARGIDPSTRTRREAWEAAARGEHVVVTTGTASGKTLAFNLPVLDALAREPKQRALYLYPTKALAQDQVRALDELRRASAPAGDLRRRHASASAAGRSASGRT